MSNSENALIQIESGQTQTTFAAMTDSGDQQVFTAGSIWSGKSGFTPDIKPNGIATGRNLLTAQTTNDAVNIAAFTAYSKGTLQTVSATATTITRAATATKAQIHSITMASDGSIAVVEGTISATQAFSETRAAAGGPPLIPVNDVELGQIRVTTSTAAPITSSEIFQVIGTHTERYDYPGWSENNIGDGIYADESAKTNSYIEFDSALPLSHVGPVAKAVYAQYYTPTLTSLSKSVDFVPAENSHSVSSVQVYGATIGSRSTSLGQGSFTALLDDGVTDTLVSQKDEIITVKFFPDRNKTAYVLTQGKIGLARTFPVDNQNQAVVTISSDSVSAEFAS